MTTTLPPHGERARYLRGCRCTPCRTAQARYCKQYDLNRHRNGPRRVDAAPATRHVQALLAANCTITGIVNGTRASNRTITALAAGTTTTLLPETARSILAFNPEPNHPAYGHWVDATGTVRRLRALAAIGHPLSSLAQHLPASPAGIVHIAAGMRTNASKPIADAVADLYTRLATQPGPSTITRRRAHKAGWPGPDCWDDDTIDDPATHPEWTGGCGTDRGWWLHRSNHIPVCPRCKAAHDEWKAQHRHLPLAKYNAALARARAAAGAYRGLAIAEDGLELIQQQGYTIELAAARLGVSRDHLQAELGRRREQLQEAA
ncbi:hypothetical protein [Streptomyces smyrnaeus]|uniref:hypothetical protein n=1 Tax=Streptomyces smyrnaeus TaxID=1387713 RepID=UPI00340B68DF